MIFILRIKKYCIKIFQLIFVKVERRKLSVQIKKSKHLIMLIGTPEYYNLGDHLIVVSEKEFLKDYFSDYDIVEVTLESYKRNRQKIQELLNTNNIEKLVITGGGFLGNIWRDMQLVVNEWLEKICVKQIIVMPQTVYYKDTISSKQQIICDKEHYEKANNLTLFLRDKSSYEFVKNNCLLTGNYYYVPDIALYMSLFPNKLIQKKRKQILFCFRKDDERILKDSNIKELADYINEHYNIKTVYKDTVENDKVIMPKNRKKELNKFILKICNSQVVITDRLHCMIMCYIYKVPCIAIDNISKKTSSVYKWLGECNYIRCISDINECKNYIPDMINCIPVQPDVTNLKLEFDKMANIISNNEILVCKEERND